ncbi:MAG: MmcQ/YjbR family DNA-binding protein [Caulobacteraceae bacterium]|nr:MmcQ/YjbR family DNA-binding protein [Caulobacteraceae bacterium]
MTEDEARAIILSFPETAEGTSYGLPAFKTAGKFLTRLRSEDASLVLTGVGFDERDLLLEADPAVFHLTDHYRNSQAVLARIDALDPAVLRAMIERRWRQLARRTVVKAYDTAKGG